MKNLVLSLCVILLSASTFAGKTDSGSAVKPRRPMVSADIRSQIEEFQRNVRDRKDAQEFIAVLDRHPIVVSDLVLNAQDEIKTWILRLLAHCPVEIDLRNFLIREIRAVAALVLLDNDIDILDAIAETSLVEEGDANDILTRFGAAITMYSAPILYTTYFAPSSSSSSSSLASK